MRGLYNPLPEAEIDKLIERLRARYRATEADCVKECQAVKSDALERCMAVVDKHWQADGGVDDCESMLVQPCAGAVPGPRLPDGVFGTCVHSGTTCIEYRGSEFRNPIHAAMRCEDRAEGAGKYSTSGCPSEGLLGACIQDEGRPMEQRVFRYGASAAKAKSECQGKWIAGPFARE